MAGKKVRRQEATRVYADTSVFGGVFDEGFDLASRRFFEEVRSGRFHLVLSAVVEDELVKAPDRVRQFYDEISVLAEFVPVSEEADALHRAYLSGDFRSRRPRRGHRTGGLTPRCAPRGLGRRLALRHHRKLEFPPYRQLPENPDVQWNQHGRGTQRNCDLLAPGGNRR